MTEKNKLFDNTVCLAVTFHRAGNNRRVKRNTVEVRSVSKNENENETEEEKVERKADQRKLGVTKQIFASKHHKACQRINHLFDQWMSKRSLECPLKRGTYLVPLDFLDEVYARLDADQAAYNDEADALAANYEDAKWAARDDLKELYREEDYPLTERLRRAFWVERKLFDFSPPEEAKLSEAVYEQEKKRWSDTFAEAEAEVKQALREACRGLVVHLADRLGVGPDGKKRTFKNATIDKLLEFFELFDRRNVLNDDELKRLVDRSRRVLEGGDTLVDALRENDDVREIVKKQMDMVTTKLDALIQEGPRRVVSFEEDE